MLEIELKFAADGDAPLELLARATVLGPATLGEPITVDEQDRYLDTADGRLAARRWACRLRTIRGRSIISLKGPVEEGANDPPEWHRRPEREGPATGSHRPQDWPPSAARDLLDRLRAGAELRERFALHQRRTHRPVLREGRTVGTLSLDRVEVRLDDQPVGSFDAVELELGRDVAEVELRPFIAALAAVPGLRPEPATKLERAVELLAPPARR